MRPTPKVLVCTVAISVGMLLVFCNSLFSEEAEKTTVKIKELQQKRLAVLEQVCDVTKKLYQNARIEYADVHAAERDLFAARLAYADTQQDQIKACDEAIQAARKWQDFAKVQHQNARSTYIPVLQAQDFELEAEIAREKAEAGK